MDKIRVSLRKSVDYLFHHHWWVMGFILVLLVGLEFTEYKLKISDTFHFLEVAAYAFLLVTVGVLIELVVRTTRAKELTMQILDQKHKLSLELMAHEDWDTLVKQVMESCAKIAGVNETQLFIWESLLNGFEYASEWGVGPRSANGNLLSNIYCQDCIKRMDYRKSQLLTCSPAVNEMLLHPSPSHCLTINYQNSPFAIIKIILLPGQTLTSTQQSILTSIGDEVAIALKAAQDRKKTSELRVTEAALAERHTVSQYLHDNLSQNLGFLRMKLDQFNNEPNLLAGKEILMDIARMKMAVDESYGIVRGKLESARPDSLPMLNNYLQEYANKVFQRSNLEIAFLSKGAQRAIPVDIQRAVFYVFQEVLSNVEKHAKASKVDITLLWAKDQLSMEIKDNGVGFNPRSVDQSKHFGLEIVHERLANIKGKIDINSSENSGTDVRIDVPLPMDNEGVVNE